MPQILRISRPDDWHIHLRDGESLATTVPDCAKQFARALVMPNLQPGLTTLPAILAYRERVLSALNNTTHFTPFFTFYLNESVDPNDLITSQQYPFILGGKLYPAGVTTHSAEGVQVIRQLYPLFDMMQQQNLVLQIHGEVLSADIFDRELVFIQEHLTQLIRDFPRLRIVLEHISTKAAVEFIQQAPDRVAATITPHHLWFNRNHLLSGGIKPHYYCLPILKREQDQHALVQAVSRGHARFFAGTDSAPHAKNHKESACGCAGVYSAPFAVAMYAEIFEKTGQLHRLDAFLSKFGAEFYQLPRNTESIELVKQSYVIPSTLPFGKKSLVPLAAGTQLTWRLNSTGSHSPLSPKDCL